VALEVVGGGDDPTAMVGDLARADASIGRLAEANPEIDFSFGKAQGET
jgi:hypothetical protein